MPNCVQHLIKIFSVSRKATLYDPPELAAPQAVVLSHLSATCFVDGISPVLPINTTATAAASISKGLMEMASSAISFLVDNFHSSPVIMPNARAPHPAFSDAEASDDTPCAPGNANRGDSTIGVYCSFQTVVFMRSTSSAISPDIIAQSCCHDRYLAPANLAYAELSMARPCKINRAQNVNLQIAVNRSSDTILFRCVIT